MFGRNRKPTQSQMRAMQQEQQLASSVVRATPEQRAQKLANEAAERASAKTAKEEKQYRDMQLREGVAPANVKPLSAKNAPPAPRPMEQVEIAKANKMAAMPQTKMPQANTVPNAQMAVMQKMPQPGTAPPANAMPMAPPTAGGAPAMKRGGSVRNKPAAKFSSSGSTSKTSSRGDGIAQRGKTKGRMI